MIFSWGRSPFPLFPSARDSASESWYSSLPQGVGYFPVMHAWHSDVPGFSMLRAMAPSPRKECGRPRSFPASSRRTDRPYHSGPRTPVTRDGSGTMGGGGCGAVNGGPGRKIAVFTRSWDNARGLAVADVTDPANPKKVGEVVSKDFWFRDAEITTDGRWAVAASFPLQRIGRYRYAVVGWVDRLGSWYHDLGKRLAAGQDSGREPDHRVFLAISAAS